MLGHAIAQMHAGQEVLVVGQEVWENGLVEWWQVQTGRERRSRGGGQMGSNGENGLTRRLAKERGQKSGLW